MMAFPFQGENSGEAAPCWLRPQGQETCQRVEEDQQVPSLLDHLELRKDDPLFSFKITLTS